MSLHCMRFGGRRTQCLCTASCLHRGTSHPQCLCTASCFFLQYLQWTEFPARNLHPVGEARRSGRGGRTRDRGPDTQCERDPVHQHLPLTGGAQVCSRVHTHVHTVCSHQVFLFICSHQIDTSVHTGAELKSELFTPKCSHEWC